MADRWVKRWTVPRSSGEGTWTVAIDKAGNYGCSCPIWKFRREECHHIKAVKANGGGLIEARPKPKYVLATVLKPTFKEEENALYIPLIAIPDAILMEATICFYLLKYGYSWGEVRELRHHLPASWSRRAVIAHVEAHGEACHPPTFYQHNFYRQ